MTEATSVYRLYGASGELLYVGIATNPWKRLTEHRDVKAWWPDVVAVKMKEYPSREQAMDAEREAIQVEGPRWNVVYSIRPTASESPPSLDALRATFPDLRGPALVAAHEAATAAHEIDSWARRRDEAMAAGYRAGVTPNVLGQVVGRTDQAVRDTLSRLGVQLRPRGRPRRAKAS